jgi:hypothetical protein
LNLPDRGEALKCELLEVRKSVIEQVLSARNLTLTSAGRSAIDSKAEYKDWVLTEIPREYLRAKSFRGRVLLSLGELTKIRFFRRLL